MPARAQIGDLDSIIHKIGSDPIVGSDEEILPNSNNLQNDQLLAVSITEYQQDRILEAVPFISKDADRIYLTGLYFDKEGFIVSSDGRAMYIAPVFASLPTDFIIPVTSAFKEILKKYKIAEISISKRDADKYAVISFNIKGSEFLYAVKCIRNLYPNWRKVVEYNEKSPEEDIVSMPNVIEWEPIYKKLVSDTKEAKRINPYAIFIAKPNERSMQIYNLSNELIGEMEWAFWVKNNKWEEKDTFMMNYKLLNKVFSIKKLQVCKTKRDFDNPWRFEFYGGVKILLAPQWGRY